MKKTILFVFMLVFIISTVSAIEAPQVNVSLLNQDPDPVGPGEYVDLRFRILNENVNAVAKDLVVELDPQYPFSLDSNEQAIRDLGNLPALGDGDNVFVIKYKVRVDDNAVEGTNPIRIRYKLGDGGWFSQTFDVNVQTVDANLAVVSVDTDPTMIKPGEKVSLKVTVKNLADSMLKHVSMKVDLTYSDLVDQATAVTATDSINAFNSLPFAPIGSTTEQKIYSLGPGEEHTFEYNLIAYTDAVAKVYKIPVELNYYDELETSYTKNDIIGLVVGSQPDLSLVVDETDLYVGKRTGTVTIKFINKGFSDVKFLDVSLADTDEYEVLSAPEVYIGNVDSDDYETADYTIYLKNGASKEESVIDVPVSIEYRDANNNVYTETDTLKLHILPPAKLGMSSNSGGMFFIVILVILGAGFFFWRSRRKHKS